MPTNGIVVVDKADVAEETSLLSVVIEFVIRLWLLPLVEKNLIGLFEQHQIVVSTDTQGTMSTNNGDLDFQFSIFLFSINIDVPTFVLQLTGHMFSSLNVKRYFICCSYCVCSKHNAIKKVSLISNSLEFLCMKVG